MLLIAGAGLFTENVAAAARRPRITIFATAFLLAGAEPEEMITAVIASGRQLTRLTGATLVIAYAAWVTAVLVR